MICKIKMIIKSKLFRKNQATNNWNHKLNKNYTNNKTRVKYQVLALKKIMNKILGLMKLIIKRHISSWVLKKLFVKMSRYTTSMVAGQINSY